MKYLAVGAGGFLGACLRYGISEWMGTVSGFPLDTLLINWSGSLFLGWFYTATSKQWKVHPTIRIGLGTGLVGAFTTFSTFTVELWNLWKSGLWWDSLFYLALSAIFGPCLAYLGVLLAEQPWRREGAPS